MPVLSCFLLLFVSGFAALCKEPLVNTISVAPGGKYAIEVTVDPQLGLVYQLRDLRKRLPLLRMRSSYQQDPGMAANWALNQTKGADVLWRSGVGAVAISESNHHSMGTVMIATINKKKGTASAVDISAQKLEEACGGRWERVRIFAEGWNEDNFLRLSIGGLPFEDKTAGNKRGDLKVYSAVVKIATSLELISVIPE